MSVPSNPRYRMSFSTGGLFFHESVELARMHVEGEPWSATLNRALTQGLSSLPKAKSQRRALRELINRISCLREEERAFLVQEADRQEQQALLWLAICRAYRFVREFAVEVLDERHLSGQTDLGPDAFDVHFDAKAEWDAGLAGLSASTRQRLRQVLFKIMREADLLTAQHRIQGANLSPRLEDLIGSSSWDDLAIFPGVRPERHRP